jgi:hypothetical protein
MKQKEATPEQWAAWCEELAAKNPMIAGQMAVGNIARVEGDVRWVPPRSVRQAWANRGLAPSDFLTCKGVSQ